MPVYMIRQGERGPVKIGVAKDVARRLEALQTASHDQLILLRVFEGGATEERRLHRQFADHRISGEWFSFTKVMLGDLGLVEIEPPAEAEEPDTSSLPKSDGEWIQRLNELSAREQIVGRDVVLEMSEAERIACRHMWRMLFEPAWKALGLPDPRPTIAKFSKHPIDLGPDASMT